MIKFNVIDVLPQFFEKKKQKTKEKKRGNIWSVDLRKRDCMKIEQ